MQLFMSFISYIVFIKNRNVFLSFFAILLKHIYKVFMFLYNITPFKNRMPLHKNKTQLR